MTDQTKCKLYIERRSINDHLVCLGSTMAAKWQVLTAATNHSLCITSARVVTELADSNAAGATQADADQFERCEKV